MIKYNDSISSMADDAVSVARVVKDTCKAAARDGYSRCVEVPVDTEAGALMIDVSSPLPGVSIASIDSMGSCCLSPTEDLIRAVWCILAAHTGKGSFVLDPTHADEKTSEYSVTVAVVGYREQ